MSIVLVTDRPRAVEHRIGSTASTELIVVLTAPEARAPSGADHVITSIGTEAAATGQGVAACRGELICFLAPTSEPVDTEWLGRLVAAIGDGVVAATPLLVHPARQLLHATPHDLRTRELGVDVIATREGFPTTLARAAGSAARPDLSPVEVSAASGACLLVERRAYEDAGGLTSFGDLDTAAVELCCRLRARGGRVVAVPAAVVADHRPVHTRRDLAGPIDPGSGAWHSVIDHHGPRILRSAGATPETTPTSFVLSVAAPSAKMASRWGDWHLAEALARSLRHLGHSVRVHSA
ncbi:MAG: hypothetical protein ACRDWD_08035, partial [Acidimicrobiia bacterium]